MAKRVLLVAGDPSGDHHAALLAAELQARAPEVELYAVGGPHLQAAGVPVIEDLTRYSAIGLADVLPG
ncbi:MAG: lipid-A-disaccharide synthase, partial [Armatimonadetes bacterium]|nr:lipid-A-disaccharide synthase [Armatimonadota bacterium]